MDYVYDERVKPLRMAERRSRAQRYIASHPEFRPICTHKKNLAESAVGKHWVWLVHKMLQQPYSLEEGRRIVRAGEVVDHHLGDDGSFRCSVLYCDESVYTVEVRCQSVSSGHREQLYELLGDHSFDLPSLRSGGKDHRWMFDPGSSALPSEDDLTFNCDCMGYDCAHVAAGLYSFGIFLDSDPLGLFKLQGITHSEILGFLSQASSATNSQDLAREFNFEILEIE